MHIKYVKESVMFIYRQFISHGVFEGIFQMHISYIFCHRRIIVAVKNKTLRVSSWNPVYHLENYPER